jgi:hypothetical protein
MSADVVLPKKPKGYIRNSTLILIAFATAFFPRVLEAVGAPAAINFLHLGTIPLACGFVLTQTRTKIRRQISQNILISLALLLVVLLTSALLNQAGVINVVMDFLLLTEPFIMLLAVVCIPMSAASAQKFRLWLSGFALINLLYAYVQKFVLHWDAAGGASVDSIKGVFIGQGAGHVIGASVSMTFGVYYLSVFKHHPTWLRLAVVFAVFVHVVISDAKQVLAVFLAAWFVLVLIKLKDVGTTIKYLSAFALVVTSLIWAVNTFPALRAFKTWIRPEIYGPEGEATKLKLAGFSIIPSYYHSPLNWWLGLGPGHTIGRLGGWMIDLYWNLLGPLGATKSPASRAVWEAVVASWLGDQSSMFSPLFGWAGIWGDLGLLGLAAYLYIWFLIWRHLCFNDLTKFLVLTVFIFGMIFSQLEEPGYMLFVTTVIGISWQEHRTKIETRYSSTAYNIVPGVQF